MSGRNSYLSPLTTNRQPTYCSVPRRICELRVEAGKSMEEYLQYGYIYFGHNWSPIVLDDIEYGIKHILLE
jgi:hypothetical protein